MLPAHLYGELCNTEQGIQLLRKYDVIKKLVIKLDDSTENLQNSCLVLKKEANRRSIKSCVWALVNNNIVSLRFTIVVYLSLAVCKIIIYLLLQLTTHNHK